MSKNLARQVANICIKEAVHDDGKYPKDAQVVQFHQPDELEKLLKSELQMNESGCSEKEFVSLCERFMALACKTWHPRFMTQLVSGVDTHSLCASWVLETLNGSSFTFEAAPVFTLIQRAVISQVLKMFGLPQSKGDGVFCPGASLANMYAMMLARQKRCPNVKVTGLHGIPRMAIFTSNTAHYSIEKGAIFLGFGLDSVVKVETDEAGCMIPEKLREAIKATLSSGRIPLMVNATAGTTMLGAFDNLELLASVCSEFKVWLHCDAAFGGSAIFSEKTAHLLAGADRCDSITWDCHKIAGVLLQCSLIVTRHGSLMPEAISTGADYLFQPDKGYDSSYDSGDKSVQCSQKADAFKFWLLWKAKGSLGMQREIDGLMQLAQFAQEKIVAMAELGFYLVLPAFQWVNVCFWYVPTWMREETLGESPVSHPQLRKVAPKVRARLRENGQLLINSAGHKGFPQYFRIVCTNRLLTEQDIVDILLLIRLTAEEIPASDFQ